MAPFTKAAATPAAAKSPALASAPNLLNLPAHLAVPKLVKDVTYRLLNAGRKTEFASRPTAPSAFSFPADCELLDPLTQLPIAVRLVGRRQRIGDSKEFFEPVRDLEFDRVGYMNLGPKDQQIFEFMERSSMNVHNPYRDPARSAYFERVDPEAAAEKQALHDDSEDDARAFLRAMDPADKVRIAAALGLAQLTDTPAIITQALRAYIKKAPRDFLLNVASATLTCKASVLQALDEKVIFFDHTVRVIKWSDSKGELCNAPTGVDATDHFVAFLLGDERGVQVYAELQKRLDKINNG